MTTGTLTGRRAASHVGAARRRVVSYNRVSSDRGDSTNSAAVNWGAVDRAVDRQVEDAEDAAELNDLGPVDHHYRDSGASASEFRTKERDEWTELLEDIASGTVAWVLVWVLDRIIRDMDDLQALLRLCRKHDTKILQTYSGTVVNPHDPDSVMVAQFQGAVAANAAAKTSMRQLRKKQSMATKGLPAGGRRAFGYEPGYVAQRPDEAAIVRDLADRFLAGESLRSLAAWLTAEGIPTPQGGKWSGPNLRGMLAGPHLAGLRTHRTKADREAGLPGTVHKAVWADHAILTRETHDHIVALLADPTRRPKGSGNARKWLLTGIATCAACGEPCLVKHGGSGKLGYACRTGRHVHRSAEHVERTVEAVVVERLSRMDASGLFADDTALAVLADLRERREALGRRWDSYVAAVATMDPEAYTAATNQLRADMGALDAEVTAAEAHVKRASRVLDGATGPEAARAWFGTGEAPGWPLSRRRAIIAELVTVELVGGRRGNAFNPEDVVVRPREA